MGHMDHPPSKSSRVSFFLTMLWHSFVQPLNRLITIITQAIDNKSPQVAMATMASALPSPCETSYPYLYRINASTLKEIDNGIH